MAVRVNGINKTSNSSALHQTFSNLLPDCLFQKLLNLEATGLARSGSSVGPQYHSEPVHETLRFGFLHKMEIVLHASYRVEKAK